jgi:hypothetical protein
MSHVAVSDCERIHDGWIAQPANTASSLAFVAAAVPLWRRGGAWKAVAAALAFEGVGSVAYHGPGGRVSKAIHDVGIVLLAAAFIPLARVLRPRPLSSALGASAITLHALSRTGGPLCSCNSKLQGHAVFHVLAAAAIVATSYETPSRSKPGGADPKPPRARSSR